MSSAEFDVVIYGATGFTGSLVVEYMALRYPPVVGPTWAMAGRSEEKLRSVRAERGAPSDTALIIADASDPASLEAMARRARCVISTVGPYALYGEPLVAACAATGTDYVDLTGEVLWMHQMIEKYSSEAQASGARIVFCCGFDSIPFDLGVQLLQEEAMRRFGAPCARVRGRIREIEGLVASGGSAASAAGIVKAVKKDPSLIKILVDPFSLAGGFRGPDQPRGNEIVEEDGVWLAPFIMAQINTKNVHRSNALLGHPYGEDFVYDEMVIAGPGAEGRARAEAIASGRIGGQGAPKPGEGPSKEVRDAGHYDYLAIGTGPDGQEIRIAVTGDKDPGYGSTSKIIAEAAISLVHDCPDGPGGIRTPAAAMGAKLRERLVENAGLTFDVEA